MQCKAKDAETNARVSTTALWPEPPLAFNPGLKLVRVNGERHGMVDFDFAVGDLALSVEMMLPAADFQKFCAEQDAVLVTTEKLHTSCNGADPDADAVAAMSWMPSDVQNSINRENNPLSINKSI